MSNLFSACGDDNDGFNKKTMLHKIKFLQSKKMPEKKLKFPKNIPGLIKKR